MTDERIKFYMFYDYFENLFTCCIRLVYVTDATGSCVEHFPRYRLPNFAFIVKKNEKRKTGNDGLIQAQKDVVIRKRRRVKGF